MQDHFAPPPVTVWHWTQCERQETGYISLLVIDATGGRGYLVTFTALDHTNTPIDPVFWAGEPLTRFATEEEARAHLFTLPINARWRFPDAVFCKGVRLYHQPTYGNPYTIRDLFPCIRSSD